MPKITIIVLPIFTVMTICLATPEYGVAGGIASFYQHLSAILSEAGHTIIVLTLNQINSELPDDKKEEGNITLITLRQTYQKVYDIYKKKSSADALYVAADISTGIAFKTWLLINHSKYKIDVIETVEVNGLGAFLADAQLPPVVVCGHGALFQLAKYDFTIFDKRYTILTSLERKALANADVVVTHSPNYQFLLANECNIKVLFARAPWQSRQQHFNNNTHSGMLVIGRLQACKGVKILADALQKSVEENNETTITWIGSDTYTAPYGSTWEKYLKRKYPSIWQKNFLWKKEVNTSEISNMIHSASAVIIPSLWETFGYTAIEAAAAGIPVIITEGTGSNYLFKDSRNASIVPSGNAEQLLQTMRQHIAHSSENMQREQYAAMINEKLSAAEAVSEREKVYATAIEKRRHRLHFEPEEDYIGMQMINLRLPVSHYFRKFINKILARL